MANERSASQVQYSKTRVGFMVFTIILCVLINGFGSFKFVPMQTAIQDFFHIGESAYGYLNTSSNWISVICAIPMGFLVRKLPCNCSIILSFGIALCGLLVQVTTTNFVLFVIGRMIEGAGTAMVTLVTGSLILNLVSPKHTSFWSGVLIMATVLPQVIMAKGGTALMLKSGLSFQSIFLIIGGIYIFAVILWNICIPFSLRISGISGAMKPTRERTLRVIKNRSGILIAIAHIACTATTITFTSYVIKFLTTKGIDPARAADIYSYTTLLGLVSMIGFGFICDRLHTKRKIAIVSFIAGAVALILLAILPSNLIFIYVLMWGTLPRSLAGIASASAANIAEAPNDIPIVNSVRNTISQGGAIILGILMGYMIQYLGYQVTIFFLAACMLCGSVCWYFARKIP